MHKHAFQALKRTFMHVSALPPQDFDSKTNLYIVWFNYQKMVKEDLRHAKTSVSGLETHVYACLMSSPTIF